MNNRQEIYEFYISNFQTYLASVKLKNKLFVPDDNAINKSISHGESLFENDPNYILNTEEKKYVANRIKSIFGIYQEEGDALLGDYEHDFEWYNKFLGEGNEQYYWNRYKYFLRDRENNKHPLPDQLIDRLENTTLNKIMSFIGNPNDESKFSVRGLVIGDVQSGKTLNYIGLITKAADAGYKVILVLTGTTEELRKQTQIRIEEGFIGYDVDSKKSVGVKVGNKTPKSFTSRKSDFVADRDKTTNMKISKDNSEPMIFVLKKNSDVLEKLYNSIKSINTTREYQKINVPILVIDDEADNASINTNKPEDDPTKINGHIRNILNLFEKSSYVGFTATPFANVFISYDDNDSMLKDNLFPRDFIYSIKAPSNYCGPKKYFIEPNSNICYIRDDSDDIFPMKHPSTWNGEILFDSLYEAINLFLIGNAIRDIRDINTKTHRSMMINMTRYINVQKVIKTIVDDYYQNVRNAVKLTQKYTPEEAIKNNYIQRLKNSFEKEYQNIVINEVTGEVVQWETLRQQLFKSIKDIQVAVVNSSKQSQKLNYAGNENGLRIIAIGGLALSRGITLEGLFISYFYRNTSTFDVLMQMGRWFGYRDGYNDLCRIYLTWKSAYVYKNVSESIDCLRNDISNMNEHGMKPKDYGIRVKNDDLTLQITAANKRRNTKKVVYQKTFYGSIFSTPVLHRDLSIIASNIEATKLLLSKIDKNSRDKNVKHPYFRNIPKNNIIELLKNITIHRGSDSYFSTKQIIAFLEKSNDLVNFDLLIMGGESDKNPFEFSPLDINVPLVIRQYDTPDKTAIRLSLSRYRLIGRSDAKHGLKNDEIPEGNNLPSQDYMIQGRNSLLIIYFIQPSNKPASGEDDTKLLSELKNSTYKYLVGFAIGFPKKYDASAEKIIYTVNSTVNYFDRDHNEEGDESNE